MSYFDTVLNPPAPESSTHGESPENTQGPDNTQRPTRDINNDPTPESFIHGESPENTQGLNATQRPVRDASGDKDKPPEKPRPEVLFVGIGGCPSSGKSTITTGLLGVLKAYENHHSPHKAISLDDYALDGSNDSSKNRMPAVDWARLWQNVQKIDADRNFEGSNAYSARDQVQPLTQNLYTSAISSFKKILTSEQEENKLALSTSRILSPEGVWPQLQVQIVFIDGLLICAKGPNDYDEDVDEDDDDVLKGPQKEARKKLMSRLNFRLIIDAPRDDAKAWRSKLQGYWASPEPEGKKYYEEKYFDETTWPVYEKYYKWIKEDHEDHEKYDRLGRNKLQYCRHRHPDHGGIYAPKSHEKVYAEENVKFPESINYGYGSKVNVLKWATHVLAKGIVDCVKTEMARMKK